jgi:hypothetical protein
MHLLVVLQASIIMQLLGEAMAHVMNNVPNSSQMGQQLRLAHLLIEMLFLHSVMAGHDYDLK